MIKKYALLIFLVIFTLVSCNNGSVNSSNNSNSEKTDDIENNFISSVILKNDSDFTVAVFNDSLRENEIGSIKAGETLFVESVSENEEAVYYITYYVDVGIDIPWFSNDSFVIATKASDGKISARINNPPSMTTKNCYVILENCSTNSIILKQGDSEIYPKNTKSSSILQYGEKGIYEINHVHFANFSSFKIITINGIYVNIPSQIQQFEQGNIYSIVINDDTSDKPIATVKSIAAFNIDTTKQIWSFTDTTFVTDFCQLRPAYKVSNGSLIMGTLKSDKTEIGLKKIDVYNRKNILYTAKFSHNGSVNVKNSHVLDFVQLQDGATVILLENKYEEDNTEKTVQMLLCYDFENTDLKWSYIFTDKMLFSLDSRNKLICTSNGKIALAGAVIKTDTTDSNDLKMYRYFSVFENNGNTILGKSYVSSDGTTISEGVETIFTSVFYDGTDFYVCGYNNCDFKYSDRIHKGIVWKFNEELSESEKIYECDNTILLCIDGIERTWYACGEYCDTGKILKGCYVTSDGENQKFIEYSAISTNLPYCYFNQMCCYENKIVLCGKASSNFDKKKDTLPLIVAYNRNSDTTLWENSSFNSYEDIGGIIPNTINTYILQLKTSSNLHYVSADLLGNEQVIK